MHNAIWVCAIAWRDSRGSHKRFLLATLTISLGIAAVVAITSFGVNVREAVHTQAKLLLGADLILSSRQPFGPETEAHIAAIGGEQSREIRCTSMAYFPQSAGTRLVQVRAVTGDFPYYGALETLPASAASTYRNGPYALVEDSLLLQFDVHLGDDIKIGAFTFTVAGRLTKVPGEAVTAALLGPRVYIPMAYLPHTALIQQGSRVTYRVAFKLPKDTDPEQLLETLRPHLNTYGLEADTVQKRAAGIGNIMENLSRFLNLVGFVALVLGGVGVASTIHVYVSEKIATIALLRCLGARAKQTCAVYMVQAAAIGISGAVLGAALGLTVQQALPALLRDFLPVNIAPTVSWSAVFQGSASSLGMVVLFALLPLLPVRHVSPWRVLRSGYEAAAATRRDPARWGVVLLIVAGVASFALTHTERWTYGLAFCAALAAALVLLLAVAQALMSLTRAYCPGSLPYVWRQGLANLYRPHNQTRVLILVLGLCTLLVLTLHFTQQTLLQQVARTSDAHAANLIWFDIQSDQRADVAQLVRSFHVPVTQEAPIVTMRLALIKGKIVEELRNDPQQTIPEWALRHEYRATYREHLLETETIMAGTWQGQVGQETPTPVVSLEDDMARALGVTVGDELVFDIQGVPVTTTVKSIRRVDWQRLQPNFFVVFSAGVLESAPQTYVLLTNVPSNTVSAAVQRAVVQQFPNVSAIDLRSVLHTLDTILSRVSFAMQFMTLFSIMAGLLVLTGAVASSQQQRLRESVLLRTLGASRRQIRQILVIEYFFLGSFAAVTGLLLAGAASWALTYWLFQAPFIATGLPGVVALLAVIGLTIMVGIMGSRGMVNRPPLEVLREETAAA